jgi:hypothetical protein
MTKGKSTQTYDDIIDLQLWLIHHNIFVYFLSTVQQHGLELPDNHVSLKECDQRVLVLGPSTSAQHL